MARYQLPKPKTKKPPQEKTRVLFGVGGKYTPPTGGGIKGGIEPRGSIPKGGGRPVTIQVKTKIYTKDPKLAQKLKEQRRFDKKAREIREKTGVDKPPIVPIREGLLSKAAKAKAKA